MSQIWRRHKALSIRAGYSGHWMLRYHWYGHGSICICSVYIISHRNFDYWLSGFWNTCRPVQPGRVYWENAIFHQEPHEYPPFFHTLLTQWLILFKEPSLFITALHFTFIRCITERWYQISVWFLKESEPVQGTRTGQDYLVLWINKTKIPDIGFGQTENLPIRIFPKVHRHNEFDYFLNVEPVIPFLVDVIRPVNVLNDIPDI
jgi:hypothetical protein